MDYLNNETTRVKVKMKKTLSNKIVSFYYSYFSFNSFIFNNASIGVKWSISISLNSLIWLSLFWLISFNSNWSISLTSKFIKKFDGKDLRDYKFTSKANPVYSQVFDEKHGFIPNLSILDLIFNIGPSSRDYLENTII